MESLINQAFAHIDNIGPHVRRGHFDLEGPEGELILREIWDKTVQPGWSITMKMWPNYENYPLDPGGHHPRAHAGMPPIRIPPNLSHEERHAFLAQAMRHRQQQGMGGGGIGRVPQPGMQQPPPMRPMVPPMGFPGAGGGGGGGVFGGVGGPGMMRAQPEVIDIRREKKTSGKAAKTGLSWLAGKPTKKSSSKKYVSFLAPLLSVHDILSISAC